MIEFCGTVSEKCNNDRKSRINKMMLLLFMLGFICAVVFTVILGVLHDKEFITLLICTIGIGIVIVLLALPLPKKRLEQLKKLNFEARIVIENGIINYYCCDINEYNLSKPIAKVKKVIDAGDWYYLIFKFGDISNSWVCQKDLIKQGTIEEFEKIFEGKIKRKK